MQKEKIGFLGAGNMAGAMIKGIIESGLCEAQDVYISDKRKEALERLVSIHRVKACADNIELVKRCRTVVIAVKPQNMKEVLQEIREGVSEEHYLISIAAGIPLAMISSTIGKKISLARAMPNTPALVQSGVSALCFGEGVGESLVHKAIKIFDAVGRTVTVPESLMDAVTALSGSGPGYLFRFMECMTGAGVELGLDEKTARLLVVETFAGAAALARASESPLSQLREMVTSPGGTTAAGLAVLEHSGTGDVIIRAINAAAKRAEEMGKSYL